MYEPETTGVLDTFDPVAVHTGDGIKPGRYKGNARPDSEAYEIHVEEALTGEVETAFYHKEDIYANLQEARAALD